MGKGVLALQRRFAGLGTGIGAAAFAGLAAGAVASVGSILSMNAALNKARDAVADFDKIAKSAKATGLGSDFYQEMAYGADLAGVGVDELNASLIAFIRNSGLAAVGQGELAGKLKQLNPELLKQLQSAKTQEERFRLVADAVKAATSETEKAAIASAAFGRNGARMVELLKDGSAGFDRTAAAAQKLGIVIDRELLVRAEEMNDQLSTASRVMDLELKKALIDLAPFLVSTARLAAGLASEFAKVVDSMRNIENQSTRGLNNQLAELGLERLEIERKILEAQDAQRGNTSVLAGAEAKLDTGVLALKARAEEIAKTEAEILAILSSRDTGAGTLPPATTPVTGGTGGTASKSRNKAAEAALREAQAVKDLIADLQTERAEIGMTDIERDKSRALRQAGAAATEDQKLAIVDLIQAIHDETEAQRQASEAAEFFKDITADAFDSLVPKIKTGNDALDQFVNTLIKAVAQAALLGNGPLAGLFGGGGGILSSLFGGVSQTSLALGSVGLFHDGGTVGTGGSVVPFPTGAPFAGVFHQGGNFGGQRAKHDEVMALVQKKENIFTDNQTDGIIGTLKSNMPKDGGRSSDVVTIFLQDDSGRMASIADQQIKTASGTIINVAVQKSEAKFAKNQKAGLA
ncbi:MAG: hypothetical protein KUA43_08835 [Hoeflea sp.]|nr:hypothetical protein [Hoeflea sp.]MBU4529770.1 hypothetical protein [Alphaproteobacteria bacterium]MBU4543331.1 hypothetical protein [Alphaproteobacteria bacterium]MBU4552518.1 hypothetical protein [Alphaproteobacteria bacterium]MBV1723534.1 hypothetical protein [Hoeflea sp.]MBV1786132.1 hypothetical protein [Hoeflea sp.]